MGYNESKRFIQLANKVITYVLSSRNLLCDFCRRAHFVRKGCKGHPRHSRNKLRSKELRIKTAALKPRLQAHSFAFSATVLAAYRKVVKRVHPDKGGQVADAQHLQAARKKTEAPSHTLLQCLQTCLQKVKSLPHPALFWAVALL